MPIVHVDMIAGRTSAQKQEIVKIFSEELARIAVCEIKDVQIIFNEVAKDSWAVGGKVLNESQ
jgi:4-oxalocrotonate tautomerase